MSSNSENTCEKSYVATTTKIMGDKWTPMILFALSEKSLRFCELETAAGGINPRTLSARLDCLETSGALSRKVFAEVPPRVEYTLTKKGQDLLPIIQDMIQWAKKYETRHSNIA